MHRGPQNAAHRIELFNIGDDPYEQSDLAEKLPDKVTELKAMLAEVIKADRDAVTDD